MVHGGGWLSQPQGAELPEFGHAPSCALPGRGDGWGRGQVVGLLVRGRRVPPGPQFCSEIRGLRAAWGLAPNLGKGGECCQHAHCEIGDHGAKTSANQTGNPTGVTRQVLAWELTASPGGQGTVTSTWGPRGWGGVGGLSLLQPR